MLPLGAQGANQAIEDAGALCVLLDGVEEPEHIATRLAIYEEVRKLRASRIQILSQVRLGREMDVQDELRKYADPPGSGTCFRFTSSRNYFSRFFNSGLRLLLRRTNTSIIRDSYLVFGAVSTRL